MFLCLASSLAYADDMDVWLSWKEHSGYEASTLKDINLKTSYIKHDFSNILLPKHNFIGYIEPDYKRLKIKFTSITKNPIKEDQYFVIGYSIVNNNKCDFEGTIDIAQVREYKEIEYDMDKSSKYNTKSEIKAQGVLLGRYKFRENKNQKFSGIFEGTVSSYWFVDKNDTVQYDDIHDYADTYKNNQYAGTWRQYDINNTKGAYWGEFRVPFSGSLDLGAGEFSPNPRYFNNGWHDFNQ